MQIKRVGVVGCGFMGSGIAQVSAGAGYEVVVSDVSEAVLEKGLSSIDYFLTRAVEKGKMTRQDKEATMSRIKGTTEIKDFAGCELVIEVVPEDLELKKRVFSELDKTCPKGAILATNTSCLPVIELAMATGRPDRVVGMHFMSPVPLNRLLELVRTAKTSEETLNIAKKFGESLGKEIIIAKDTPGFIFNRLQVSFKLNAVRLLEAGIASAEEIDKSMTIGAGYPIGPLATMDFTGIDIIYKVARAIYEETKDPQFAPPILMRRMVASGWLGRKTGKGFYDYTAQEKDTKEGASWK